MQSRIVGSIRILRKAETAFSDQEIRRMEAILYIMATKFLNESELKKIKEEMAMTKLGQMIRKTRKNLENKGFFGVII